MCNITDAKRELELATTALQLQNIPKAIQHYLEASSIYLLQHQLTSDPHLLEHAQEHYQIAQQLKGNKNRTTYSKEELARRTLHELNLPKNLNNVLEQIKQLVQ